MFSYKTNDAVLQVVERYRFVRAEQIDTVRDEILTRFRKIHGFCTALSREYDRMNARDPAASDSEYDWAYDHLKQQFDLPDGIYGLHPEGEFDKNWAADVEELVANWADGLLDYKSCVDVLWQLDERYDTDMHHVLYGIVNAKLSGIEYKLLESFVFEFGMRNRDKVCE